MRLTFISLGLSFLGLAVCGPAPAPAADCTPAERCPDTCRPPDCQCSGDPTNIELEKRPQIVYLTFDDALTATASDQFYSEIFGGEITNPNGCTITGTHFITHSYTDYSLVNHYWHMGHEIAIHSITHRNDIMNYWKQLDKAGWEDEMVGMRKMAGQFSALNPCEFTGIRAPFLQAGGDVMFEMMKENNFKYDSSWPTRTYGHLNAMTGIFPYTLDYQTVQDCPVPPCPECSHPGLWEQPLIDLEDEWIGANPQYPTNGMPCNMLDACVFISNFTAEHVYGMLMKNFERVYLGDVDDFGDFLEGQRAPWGLYMHAAWFFGQPWHFEGYMMFLKEISTYDDVWIVPVKSGLKYMQNPLTQAELVALGKSDESPFGCQAVETETAPYDKFRCGNPKSCRFVVNQPDDGIINAERYMTICSHWADENGGNGGTQNCPETDNYPWLGNHCGGNTPCRDCTV